MGRMPNSGHPCAIVGYRRAHRPPAVPKPNAINVNQAVNVHLAWTPFWSPDMMSDEAKDELGTYGRIGGSKPLMRPFGQPTRGETAL